MQTKHTVTGSSSVPCIGYVPGEEWDFGICSLSSQVTLSSNEHEKKCNSVILCVYFLQLLPRLPECSQNMSSTI